MSHTTDGFIYTTSSAGIDVESDLGTVLGTGSGDVGTNCTSDDINVFSKFKPSDIVGYESPDESALKNINWSLDAHGATSEALLPAAVTAGYEYKKAQSPYFRVLDFNKYYQSAPYPFMQMNGTSLTIDMVSGWGVAALFYFFFKNAPSSISNKKPSSTTGIGSETAVPTSAPYRLPSCIAVDESSANAGDNLRFYVNGSYYSLLGAYAGLVIFDSTLSTVVTRVFSEKAISTSSPVDNDMYRVSLESLSSLTVGTTYKAIACAKKETGGLQAVYLPVYGTEDNPAIFDLKLGGMENYYFAFKGASETNTASPATTLTSANEDYYVAVDFTNDSGHPMVVGHGANTKFWLKATIVVSGGIGTVTRSTSTVYDSVNSTSSQADINIAAGATGRLMYRINKIWQVSETSSGTIVPAGTTAEVSVNLYFGDPTNNKAYTQINIPRVTITHS